MPYTAPATSSTPALIIYLIDVSASMNQELGKRKRIEVVSEAFGAALREMIFRSTRGQIVKPRYRLAMIAYSDEPYDILGGIKTVQEVAALGIPEFKTVRATDTYKAFLKTEELLKRELPNLSECPAPLVCHITDGEFTGNDPEPVVRRIMGMRVNDGNVLIENVFISDRILPRPITHPKEWAGILSETKLDDKYARTLRAISSPLPNTYRSMMLESGYNISEKAVMMLPGDSSELVEMGFVMSAATIIGR